MAYKRRPMEERKCPICYRLFLTNLHNKTYCSNRCVKEHVRREIGRSSQWKHLSSGTVGSIQELRVSTDLLIKGWEVFRALSLSASCDLLLQKNGTIIRMEVRTGYRGKSGKIYHATRNIRAEYLAIALPNEIIYIPELP